MKNILIDEILFKPTTSKSGGLITGLKRLSAFSFNLYVNNKSKINELIRALIELENITLKDSSEF